MWTSLPEVTINGKMGDEILDVGLFFEERAEIFLLTFLAVTKAGLAICGF